MKKHHLCFLLTLTLLLALGLTACGGSSVSVSRKHR